MSTFVVGLGSNLGSRAAMIDTAAAVLRATPGLEVGDPSPLYVTDPLGGQGQPYFNAALRVAWDRSAHDLLDRLLEVERWLGRVRTVRFGPRTIDLDLLWGEVPVHDPPRLVLPHPGLRERAFALAPLLDVAPELRHRFGEVLGALGGAPPGVWGPPDAWDRAAEQLLARLGGGTGPSSPGPQEVRACVAPAGSLEEPSRLAATASEVVDPTWRILRVALGPSDDDSVRIFLAGTLAQR